MGRELLTPGEKAYISRDGPYKSIHTAFTEAFPHNQIGSFERYEGRMYDSFIPGLLWWKTKKPLGGYVRGHDAYDGYLVCDTSTFPSVVAGAVLWFCLNIDHLTQPHQLQEALMLASLTTYISAVQRFFRYHEFAHLIHMVNRRPTTTDHIRSRIIEERLTNVAARRAIKASHHPIDKLASYIGTISPEYDASFFISNGRKYIPKAKEAYYAAAYLNGYRFGKQDGRLVTFPSIP